MAAPAAAISTVGDDPAARRQVEGKDDNPARPRGAFIVFEGVDRSGKTTQAKLLADRLAAHHMRFPDRSTGIGSIIDRYLRKELELEDHAVHLLYSANRWELCPQIEEKLRAGIHVVCDRYSYSGVAYSSAKGLDLGWCWEPEVGLPRPDVVLMLDLDQEKAGNRPGWGGERYENSEMQAKVRRAYARMHDPGYWVRVDAGRSVEEVAADILALAEATIRKTAGQPEWGRLGRLAEDPPASPEPIVNK